MIPILYEKTEKNFATNGIGRLSDAISCVVTEVKNGEYTLEMEYPATGKYYEEIKEERIIYAKPNDGEGSQPFSVFRISKPINGIVTVSAQHISYLLNKMIVMPFTADTCQEAMSLIPTNTIGGTAFTFWTDKHVVAEFRNDAPRGVRGLLGGEQGSILEVYGKGEYEFDHFAVRLHVNRGADRGVTLRYGKNITGLENTLDMSNVYTGIVPFWKTEDDVLTLPERVIWSNYTGAYAYNLVKTVDFTGEWQDKPTVEQLRERAQRYLNDNEGWVLPQNITVSFVHLADTEEYRDIAPLERVRLCDTVTVIDTPLGVNIKATVIKTVYDTLLERYQSVEVGEARPNLRTVIEEKIRDPIIEQTSSRMQAALKNATELLRGGKGGYLIINTQEDGTPSELLLMNTPDKNTATQVLRINKNGIGFSKSYDGLVNTAWTLDGHFVADYIDTGTLNADLIRTGILRGYDNSRNYWNMKTGEFHMRSDGVEKGIDFANGVLSINADTIKTGTLTANLIKTGVLGDLAGKNYWNMETGAFSLSAGATVDGSAIVNEDDLDIALEDAIDSYDNSLNQRKVFNKLTNNGQTQGIYLYNNRLYINADYIATGVLTDVNGNTTFDLSTGELTIGKGSIDIGGSFSVDSYGHLTAEDVDIGGSFTSADRYGRELYITTGAIYGSDYGSSVGNIRFQSNYDDNCIILESDFVWLQGDYYAISGGDGTLHVGQSGWMQVVESIRDNGDGTITWETVNHRFTGGLLTSSL